MTERERMHVVIQGIDMSWYCIGVLQKTHIAHFQRHALDAEKSAEIIRVQYDTGQNEIVTIGSDVEIIKVPNSFFKIMKTSCLILKGLSFFHCSQNNNSCN